MREAGNPSERRASSAEISALAYTNRPSDSGVPVSAYNSQAEITAPSVSAAEIEAAEQAGVVPVFQPPETPESFTKPVTEPAEHAGATAVGQTVEELTPRHLFPVQPIQFRAPAIASAPEEAGPQRDTPVESNEDAEPPRAYGSGQIRDLIEAAKEMLDERGLDIRDVLTSTQQKYLDELLSDKTNEQIADDLHIADAGSVSRTGRNILRRLETSPQTKDVFPSDMFEPQGPIERQVAPNSFTDLFRKARESAGLTQADVADILGTSRATTHRLENGIVHPPIVYVHEKLNKLGFDAETVETLMTAYAADHAEAHPPAEENGEAASANASNGRGVSYTRDTIQSLHEEGIDLRHLIAESDVRRNVKNNLLAALDEGLLGDSTLAQVADKAGTSVVSLNRHMRALVEDLRDNEQYADMIPEPPTKTEREPYQGIGAQLNQARGDITISEMADLLGLSTSSIIRFQLGETFPDPSIAEAYSTVLVKARRITQEEAEQYIAGYSEEHARATAQAVARRA